MMPDKMWMVRAGRGAYLMDEFKNINYKIMIKHIDEDKRLKFQLSA